MGIMVYSLFWVMQDLYHLNRMSAHGTIRPVGFVMLFLAGLRVQP